MHEHKKEKETFLDALKLTAGNITQACEKANIGRRTIYKWKDEDEAFLKGIEDVKETLLDLTESKLMECINEKNITAIIFYLKTQAKHRGYIEKVQNELSGDVKVNIPLIEWVD